MTFNPNTPWARHLVNLNQTTEQRREKYYYARSLGANVASAQRMRDWRLSKIKRCFRVKTD